MIYATSDLHYGMSGHGDELVRNLSAWVSRKSREGDALIIAGDIGVTDADIEHCLWLFHGFRGMRMAVPGNHDVWVAENEPRDSEERLNGLSRIFESAGFHPLHTGPIKWDGTAFAGVMGWYDYSFRDSALGITIPAYETKIFPGDAAPSWNDARYVRWRWSDADFAAAERDVLSRQLARLNSRDEVIVVTHFVPTKALLFHPRFLVPRRWRFNNAFLGSEGLRIAISESMAVKLALCGHIHSGRSVKLGSQKFVSIGRYSYFADRYGTRQVVSYDGKDLKRKTFR